MTQKGQILEAQQGLADGWHQVEARNFRLIHQLHRPIFVHFINQKIKPAGRWHVIGISGRLWNGMTGWDSSGISGRVCAGIGDLYSIGICGGFHRNTLAGGARQLGRSGPLLSRSFPTGLFEPTCRRDM